MTQHTPEAREYTLDELTAPRRNRTALWAAVAVCATLPVAAAAVVIALVVTRQHNTAAPAAPAASAAGVMMVEGMVELDQGDFAWNSVSDPTCYGIGGYDDLRGGAQVTISDAAGKVLIVGTLDAGRAFDITTSSSGSIAGSCRLTFTVRQVPRGRGPYGIAVSHRPAGHYAEADLAGRSVELQP